MNVPQAILKGVMQPYFQWAQAFRGELLRVSTLRRLCTDSALGQSQWKEPISD